MVCPVGSFENETSFRPAFGRPEQGVGSPTPETRPGGRSRETSAFAAAPPPAPCRSSAAVSVAGSLNPPSMARRLGDFVAAACGRLNAAIALPANPSEPSRPQPRIRADQEP